jgi:DNA-directed RNA polymerase subunit K/omega
MMRKSVGGKPKAPVKASKSKAKKDASDDDYDIEEEHEIEDDVEDEQEFESDDDDESSSSEEEEEEDDKKCPIDDAIKDDELYFANGDDELEPKETTKKFVNPEDRIAPALLTHYEMVRIIGERTKQLMEGAKPLVKNYQGLPYDRIAIEELKMNMVPFKIVRPMPNGTLELWKLVLLPL